MESSLSHLTGRDRYLVITALAAAIALLERAEDENWRDSALADMRHLLANMADEREPLEALTETGNALVARVLSRTMEYQPRVVPARPKRGRT